MLSLQAQGVNYMRIARSSDSNLVDELRALGDLCSTQGDLSRAEQHYRLALNLFESSFPERHIDGMVCLLKLVEILQEQGKLDEAKQLEQRIPALNARRRD